MKEGIEVQYLGCDAASLRQTLQSVRASPARRMLFATRTMGTVIGMMAEDRPGEGFYLSRAMLLGKTNPETGEYAVEFKPDFLVREGEILEAYLLR